MVHLISVNLILVHLFLVHILLVHTLWNFSNFFFHGSPITHGSPKVCEPVNHGSHVTHAPNKIHQTNKENKKASATNFVKL